MLAVTAKKGFQVFGATGSINSSVFKSEMTGEGVGTPEIFLNLAKTFISSTMVSFVQSNCVNASHLMSEQISFLLICFAINMESGELNKNIKNSKIRND